MKILLDDKEYEMVHDEKEGFDLEELKNKYTDYFHMLPLRIFHNL